MPGRESSSGKRCWLRICQITEGARKERRAIACLALASRRRLDSCSRCSGPLAQLSWPHYFSPPQPQGPAAFQCIKGSCFPGYFLALGSSNRKPFFYVPAGKELVQGICRASSMLPQQFHLGPSLISKLCR